MKTNLRLESSPFCYVYSKYKIEEINGKKYIMPEENATKKTISITEHIDDFKTLKKLYFKYQEYINDNFVNIQKLVQTILEKDSNDLTYIRPIILRKINSDPKLYEIVNGMFVNDLNVCKTANYVYMHRNTINNKLITIKEETGLDIQKFQDAVILYVLLKK